MYRRLQLFKAYLLLLFFMLVSWFGTAQEQTATDQVLLKKWESQADFKTPESAFYDTERDIIYVSNINGNPAEKDGNGFISMLGTDGQIVKLQWVEGLNAPKGMGVLGNRLYVTDIDVLVEINIADGRIIKRYPVDGAMFLNDIAIDEKGNVYFSDMQTNKIHKLKKGIVSTWLEGDMIKPTNGLFAKGNNLLVGCSKLLSVNIPDKKITVIQDDLETGIDGLAMDASGRIVFSHWKGKVFLVKDENESVKILDTSADNIQSADIFIIPDGNILLVPTFFNNRVAAYHIVN